MSVIEEEGTLSKNLLHIISCSTFGIEDDLLLPPGSSLPSIIILCKRSLPSTHLVHDKCILKCKVIFCQANTRVIGPAFIFDPVIDAQGIQKAHRLQIFVPGASGAGANQS